MSDFCVKTRKVGKNAYIAFVTQTHLTVHNKGAFDLLTRKIVLVCFATIFSLEKGNVMTGGAVVEAVNFICKAFFRLV